MSTTPTNNDCFNNSTNPIVPTGGYDTPIDEGSLGGNSNGNGNNTGSGNGSDTPNDQGSNNNNNGPTAPQPAPSNADVALYTKLSAIPTISTNGKLLTIKITNYPSDIIDNTIPIDHSQDVVFDYTLISPLITYTITKNLSIEPISLYTFTIKFYRNTIINSGTEIFSDIICNYIKINPLQVITRKMICNYMFPHFTIPNVYQDKVKAITIELTDENSELDTKFTTVNVSNKFFAISRM